MLKQLFLITSSVIIIMFFINSTVCQVKEDTLKSEDVEITWHEIGRSLIIPESEIPKYEHEALRGSSEAALSLYLHYDITHDFKEFMYWCCIAAENGHVVSQYNYAYFLLDEKYVNSFYDDPKMRERAKERAVFWLKKAAEKDHQYAKEMLEEIEKQ